MPLRSVTAGLGAALLFATGVAAALADSPPPDAATTTTTTSTPDSTSTSTSTSTETTSTTTATPTTTTTAPSPVVPTATSGLPRGAPTPVGGLERGGRVTAKTPEGAAGTSRLKKKHRHRRSKPLEVTPPLGQAAFVFPVVGDAGYIDTYGDERSDVHGGWHHGDDIFAPLGTPVVAVASGTINRVGWERVGGWRLWVRDTAADEFYYAHLSGYAPTVFHSKRVRAGQVIGFVGDTGDAFGGSPHLHFEIHPRQLLRLNYDGAVDPTTYLNSWSHLASVRAPRPTHPRWPKAPALQREARLVFRELLAARQPTQQPSPPVDRPPFLRETVSSLPLIQPHSFKEAAGGGNGTRQDPTRTAAMTAALISLYLLATAMLLARARRSRNRRVAMERAAEADGAP